MGYTSVCVSPAKITVCYLGNIKFLMKKNLESPKWSHQTKVSLFRLPPTREPLTAQQEPPAPGNPQRPSLRAASPDPLHQNSVPSGQPESYLAKQMILLVKSSLYHIRDDPNSTFSYGGESRALQTGPDSNSSSWLERLSPSDVSRKFTEKDMRRAQRA